MATLKLHSLPDNQAKAIHRALQALAQDLTQAYAVTLAGEPEDQLKTHVHRFVVAAGLALGRFGVVAKTESRVADVQGRPDLDVGVHELLTGHIELKAPDHGVNPRNFRRHEQWQDFKNRPDLTYTDNFDSTRLHTQKRAEHMTLREYPISL